MGGRIRCAGPWTYFDYHFFSLLLLYLVGIDGTVQKPFYSDDIVDASNLHFIAVSFVFFICIFS